MVHSFSPPHLIYIGIHIAFCCCFSGVFLLFVYLLFSHFYRHFIYCTERYYNIYCISNSGSIIFLLVCAYLVLFVHRFFRVTISLSLFLLYIHIFIAFIHLVFVPLIDFTRVSIYLLCVIANVDTRRQRQRNRYTDTSSISLLRYTMEKMMQSERLKWCKKQMQ